MVMGAVAVAVAARVLSAFFFLLLFVRVDTPYARPRGRVRTRLLCSRSLKRGAAIECVAHRFARDCSAMWLVV